MPIFQNPVDQSPEEYVAGRFLQSAASRSAGAYVAQAVSGQNPATYDEGWANIADQFRQQFPNVDPERAQEIYQNARHSSAIAGLTSTPIGGREDTLRTWRERIPVVGGLLRSNTNERDTEALGRIRDGGATLDDYRRYRELQSQQDFQANRSNLRAAGDTIADSAAFGADMAIANLAVPGAGALPGLSRLAAYSPLAARTAAGAIRGIGINNAMPGRVMAQVSQHTMPDVARDENGQLHIGGNKTWGDAFQGYVDSQIEVWTEMSGEALLRGGSWVLNRVPGGVRAQAIASGLAARISTNPGLRTALNEFGWSNMLGEFLEERAGELARGATGVGDFGAIGNALTPGHRMEALNQLMVEGLAFGGMQVGVHGTSVVMNRMDRSPGQIAMQSLQRAGFSETAARNQVMTAAESIANGTATPEEVRPGPLRTLAEAVQERVQAAEQIPTQAETAVEQAQSGTAPRIPAENAVPNKLSETVNSQLRDSSGIVSAQIGQNLTTSPGVSRDTPALPAASQAAQPAPQTPSPTQVAPDALAGQPVASTGATAVTAPSAAHVTNAPAQGLAGLWLRHFAGETGIREQINAQAKLTSKESAVLWSRLPVEQGGEGKTLDQVGKEQGGVSRQRIEQVEKKARAKAAFDVSVNQFKQQAAGLGREGASVTTAKEAGFKATSTEGFQARETPARPEDIVQDKMIAILEEAQAAGKPLTESQRKAVSAVALDLMTRIENETRNKKSKGFSPARIEKALRDGLQVGEASKAHEAPRNSNTGGERLSTTRGAAEPASAQPITPEQIKAVAELSPAHAALIGKAQKLIISSQLPIGHKMAYLRAQVEVLGRMQVAHAELAAQNLKDAKFFTTAKELTASIKDSPAARAALAAGQYAGGSFNDTTGVMRLDGATSKESVARTAGHEYSHVGEGKETAIAKTPGWKNAWAKELKDGQLTDYAKHDVDEGLAEIMGEILSGEMSTEALWKKFPLVAVELEGHGWIAERSGSETFNKPADIFDYPISDGPLHADILLRERLHVSKDDVKAGAKVALTWAGKLKERALDYIHNNIRPAIRLVQAAKKVGYSPSVGMDYANVMERLQFGDKRYAEDMRTNGMATVLDGHYTRTGMPWEKVIEGLTPEHKEFVDKKTGWWDKISSLFDDKEMTKFDQWAIARDVTNEYDIGQRNLAAAHAKYAADIENIRERVKQNAFELKKISKTNAKLERMDPSRKKLVNLTYENAKNDFEVVNNRLKIARKLTEEAYAKTKEDSRVRMTLVSAEQLAAFREVLASTSPEFAKTAAPIADRLTKEVYNASLLSRASPDVHNITMDAAQREIAAHPTYIEMTRVMDEDWDTHGEPSKQTQNLGKQERRKGGSSRKINPPLVTAYNRYQKTASIVLEQIRRNELAKILKLNLPGWSEQGDKATRFEIEKDGLKAEQLARKLNLSQAEIDAFIGQIEAMGATAQAYFIQKPWSAKEPNLFWWKNEKGELENFKILDRALYELVTGQQGNGNAVIEMLRAAGNIGFNTPAGRFKILPAMTQLVKTGATTASAAFQINNTLNPMRDPLTFLTNTIDQTTVKDLPAMIARVYMAEVNTLRGKTDDVLFQYFKQTGGEATKMFPAKDIPNMGSSKIEYIKQLVNAAQAGELAPRFLEFRTRLKQLDWSEEKINEEVAKAHAEGGNYRDPVPFGVRLEAETAAAEVTGPFARGGILTRELNQVVPFFQPSIAVLGKQISNWRTNAKGAAIAMGIYLGFKLIHFLRYKDEDWYKELNGYDRFNNFVVMTPIGLRRIQGARGFEVPIGGTLTSLLERMYGQRPDLIGLLAQTRGALEPPTPIPAPVSLAWELQGNQDWLGRPIVPGRDERLSGWDKAKQYQVPYALRALTGGRAEVSLRGAGLTVAAQVRPHRSVDELFTQFGHLETARAQAQRQGLPFQLEAEYRRFSQATTEIRNISRTLRGEAVVNGRVVKTSEPSSEMQEELRQRQSRVARRAMGWSI